MIPYQCHDKADVLLNCEISLKVICEKVNFQTVIFAIIFMTRNENTYKLFKNIFNFVQTKGKRKINMA